MRTCAKIGGEITQLKNGTYVCVRRSLLTVVDTNRRSSVVHRETVPLMPCAGTGDK